MTGGDRAVLQLAQACRRFFARRGLPEVYVPLLEPADTFEGIPGLNGDALFRVVHGSQVYVLRADATLPLARRVAAAGVPAAPACFAYVLSVVRRRPDGHGVGELWQAGVERAGPPGDADDAGMLRLGLELLASTGVERPLVAVGHQGVLAAILRCLVPDPAEAERLRRALVRRELAAVAARLREAAGRDRRGRPAAGLLDPAVDPGERPGLLRELAAALPEAAAPVEELLAVAAGLGPSVRVELDVALCRRPDYYDGLVFEVCVEGCPQPVLVGGRCDAVLRRFGGQGTWAGFAVDLEALAVALAGGEVGVLLRGYPVAP